MAHTYMSMVGEAEAVEIRARECRCIVPACETRPNGT